MSERPIEPDLSPPVVRPATWADRARWNGFVERHPSASVYHRWEFAHLFDEVMGARNRSLLALRDGFVCGVLPLNAVGAPGVSPSLVSLPWFGHGGALADDDSAWHALVRGAEEAMVSLGAKRVELRHGHPVPAGKMVTRDDKVLMRLALPPTMDELYKRLGKKHRSDVRRPEKEGLTSHVGGIELVPEFFAAYSDVMRDLGSPCLPRALFDAVVSAMPDRCAVVVVRYEGTAIAGGVLAGMGTTVEIPCAGAMHRFARLRANMMLYAAAIGAAIDRGYREFSFGRSSLDSGTFTFKKNWGAEPVPLGYHCLLREGSSLPEVRADNPRVAKAVEAWKRLPVPLATVVGPRLVRYLP